MRHLWRALTAGFHLRVCFSGFVPGRALAVPLVREHRKEEERRSKLVTASPGPKAHGGVRPSFSRVPGPPCDADGLIRTPSVGNTRSFMGKTGPGFKFYSYWLFQRVYKSNTVKWPPARPSCFSSCAG